MAKLQALREARIGRLRIARTGEDGDANGFVNLNDLGSPKAGTAWVITRLYIFTDSAAIPSFHLFATPDPSQGINSLRHDVIEYTEQIEAIADEVSLPRVNAGEYLRARWAGLTPGARCTVRIDGWIVRDVHVEIPAVVAGEAVEGVLI